MHRLLLPAFLVLLSSTAVAQVPEPLDPRCEKLLPAAEAQKLTGISPLQLVGRFQVESAGGNCNYVKGGKLVFLLTLDTGGGAEKAWRRRYSENPLYRTKKMVPGLGSEAFFAMDALFVRKGNDAASFGSFMDMKTFKPILDQAALVAVAKSVVGKL
jgi:hypothetical protein